MRLKFVLAFDPDCNIPERRDKLLVIACYPELMLYTIPNVILRMCYLAA